MQKSQGSGGGGDSWTYKTYKDTVRSSPQQTNTQCFYRLGAFLLPTQEHQSTEGKGLLTFLWTQWLKYTLSTESKPIDLLM